MKQVEVKSAGNPVETTKYIRFKGVDMTTDPTQVDNSRSPFAPNLVSDEGGFPEKRVGWRVLCRVEQPVNGLFCVAIDGANSFLIHGGGKLYSWVPGGEPVQLRNGVFNAKSTAFPMNGKLWLLTGSEYLVYDGTTVKPVSEEAYLPTTIIAREPTGGGEPYEEVNLLQPKRRNFFAGNGSARVFQLDTTNLDAGAVEATVNDVAKTEGTDFTVNRELGKVSFAAAPPKPGLAGQDNVKITFAKTVEGYAARIGRCRASVLYGIGSNDRAFVTGNPDRPSTDWHSGLSDPSYFPDINYTSIGSDNTAVMGYTKIGEQLVIIKEDNSQDSTIFLRNAKMENINGQQKAVFPLKQGATGVGAVSRRSFAVLGDEPLFLSRRGVYGIVSSNVTAERTVQNRSYFIDPVLCRESGLENAVCTEWQGWYLVCVNGRCYLLDGRQNKTYKPQSNGDYVYECYHWENVPAVCFLEWEGNLFFGTADGRVCRFNNDGNPADDRSRYSDDGAAITCYWSTKADDDGDFMSLKTMMKKGSGLLMKPHSRSGCKVMIRTEKDFGREIRAANMDVFDFNDMDFTRFSFNTSEGPQVVPFNCKVKKYKTLQIIVKNDTPREGFGLYGIIKRFLRGNYVKR